MNAAPAAVAGAATFIWLGMVLAISFVEAPLKFRAPVSRERCSLNDSGVQVRASRCLSSGLDAEHRGRWASAARCVPGRR